MLFVNFMNIKSSKCYCVKCSRMSTILFFYISQGSAATHLRCGGHCGMGFVANFLENTIVKKMKIGQHLCKSYERTNV